MGFTKIILGHERQNRRQMFSSAWPWSGEREPRCGPDATGGMPDTCPIRDTVGAELSVRADELDVLVRRAMIGGRGHSRLVSKRENCTYKTTLKSPKNNLFTNKK